MSKESTSAVQVAVRVRPFNKRSDSPVILGAVWTASTLSLFLCSFFASFSRLPLSLLPTFFLCSLPTLAVSFRVASACSLVSLSYVYVSTPLLFPICTENWARNAAT